MLEMTNDITQYMWLYVISYYMSLSNWYVKSAILNSICSGTGSLQTM